MIRAITIDRSIDIGVYAVRARTLTIDEDGFEFRWNISPAPTRPGTVEDPDSGTVRFERFVTPVVEWRIRDNSGRRYEGAGGLQHSGENDTWEILERYRPHPPSNVEALVLTLQILLADDPQAVNGRELETIRVPLGV